VLNSFLQYLSGSRLLRNEFYCRGEAFSFKYELSVILVLAENASPLRFQREDDMRKLKSKVFISIAILLVFVVFATPILAQQGEIMAGRMAGEQAAKANVNGTMWLAVGCIGGLLGVIIAYIYEPSPSSTMLLGKSPEYVAAYSDAYKMTAKKTQTNKAWTGCIVFTLVYTAVYVLAIAAANSTT